MAKSSTKGRTAPLKSNRFRTEPGRDGLDRVGFYGCDVLDGVVRVSLAPGADRFPQSAIVDCPCGNRHLVDVAWRKLNEGEALDPDLEVEPKD